MLETDVRPSNLYNYIFLIYEFTYINFIVIKIYIIPVINTYIYIYMCVCINIRIIIINILIIYQMCIPYSDLFDQKNDNDPYKLKYILIVIITI